MSAPSGTTPLYPKGTVSTRQSYPYDASAKGGRHCIGFGFGLVLIELFRELHQEWINCSRSSSPSAVVNTD